MAGATECLRALLGACASVDLANEIGSTPLHEAARAGQEVIARLLDCLIA
jgi:ankyrin repeat protein